MLAVCRVHVLSGDRDAAEMSMPVAAEAVCFMYLM